VNGATLAGWLVKAARLAALQAMRAEGRRRTREQKAAEMKNVTQADPAGGDWNHVSPLLDEALARLSDADRSAVTLRYLEGNSSRLTADQAMVAYDQSLVIVDMLIPRGTVDWNALFRALSDSSRTEYTFDNFGLRYSDLESELGAPIDARAASLSR